MAVTLLTFSGQNILPEYDAEARKGMTGFTSMPAVTLSGSNLIHLTECYGMIAGYQFQITAMDVTVSLPSSGAINGALYLHMDTTNAQTPLEVIAGAIPTYVYGNGVYDMEIARFTATPSGVDAPTITAPPALDKWTLQRMTAYAVDDVVRVPGILDRLFICVTAGTTGAIPSGLYFEELDPDTDVIQDGTAGFMILPYLRSYYSNRISLHGDYGDYSSLVINRGGDYIVDLDVDTSSVVTGVFELYMGNGFIGAYPITNSNKTHIIGFGYIPSFGDIKLAFQPSSSQTGTFSASGRYKRLL